MARRIPRYVREAEEAEQIEAAERRSRIAADISQQAPTTSLSAVPLYYEDDDFVCKDCGNRATWTAEQQKWWYEVAKGPLESRAVRCDACRAALRANHGGTPRRSHRDRREASET